MPAACLVTGGAGFIGSHLADALLESGRAVRVLDNFSSGKRENVPARAELLEGDLRDAAAVDRAVEGTRLVFHLAALASVPASVERPLECNAINVEGTLRLLRAAARAGARRVVFASSTAVYGETRPPVAEDAPKRPISPYAASKLAGELLCSTAAEHFGIETVRLRFFNVYGPRQDPKSQYAAVIPIFVSRLRQDRTLPIYGDGRQTRDFVFVRDVVRAMLLAAEAPAASGRAYNVATGRAVSVADLARAVSAAADRPPQLEFLPPRAGDIVDSWADVSAAARDLGFRASTTLEDGLRETVESFLRA